MRKLFLLLALTLSAGLWAQEIDAVEFVEEGLKFEVTSLDPKTVKVIANDYEGLSFTIPATVRYLENDYAVTAIGENAFAGVGSQSNPADLLLPADWKGTKPAATATLWYGGYFVDYRAATIAYIKAASDEAKNSIAKAATDFVEIEGVKQAKADAASALANAQATADNTISAAVDMSAIANAKEDAISAIDLATDEALAAIQTAIVSFKEGTIDEIEQAAATAKKEIDGLGVYYTVTDQARNEIDIAVAAAEASITNATSQDDVNTAIDNAQNIINQQLATVQDYYERLQAAKQAAIADVDKAAADAEVAINQAAEGYGNIETVQHVVVTYQGQLKDLKDNAHVVINEETNLDKIGPLKENTIQHIKTEQDKAVEDIQTAIQEFIALQQNAIKEVEQAAATAKEKIDGLGVEESVKNGAKDAIDAIVATTKSDINAATSADVITAAKEEGIQALKDVYNVQRKQERLATLDAVTVTQTAVDDYSYMLEDGVQFTFDGDKVHMTVNGEDEADFTLSETVAIIVCPAHTFKLKANQDPDHPTNYYSTFYTSEGAYKVPATAKAYIGKVTKGEDINVLRLTPTVGGLIPASEAVVLRATQSDITLMPSSRQDAASDDNMLLGSDEPMTMPANSYALSLGQDGVCFYDFSGRELPANKAYLTLAAQSNGLRFSFSDATDIDTPQVDAPANAYNLQGQQVDETYQGIVIINGKKVLKR